MKLNGLCTSRFPVLGVLGLGMALSLNGLAAAGSEPAIRANNNASLTAAQGKSTGAAAIGGIAGSNCLGDANGDGLVDTDDLLLVINNFGQCNSACACPAGASDEGEPCGSDTNGGCNSAPPVFTPIACGQTYCGLAFAEGGTRDTDWYEVTIGGTANVTLNWTVTSSFPGALFILDANCPPALLAQGTTTADCTPTTISFCAAPGTYRFFAATSVFEGIPCDSGSNDYVATLTCVADDCKGADIFSCVGNCGGQAPSGCFCDEVCCSAIDCCADKFAVCGGCNPDGGGDPLSCVGNCGGQASSGCFCDEVCCSALDCCDDKFAVCGGCDPGGGGNDSCVGNCGGQAPAGCFCDETCCQVVDCCPDKVAACGGCSP